MMTSVASPQPSLSPTPPPATSASPHHQLSTKPGALVSVAKSLLSEQNARLALKHSTDLELLDDLLKYFKTRCSIERDYAQALGKLNSSYTKKSSPLLTFIAAEDDLSDVKTIYTSWKVYQDETEKHAKGRLAQFEQLTAICDQLKAMRSHKVQIAKKCLDTHHKKMQEEILNSVTEIDKTRKLYFEEEHLAKQARDKEEKVKKGKSGIFSSLAKLQTKKERTSAHREASDIQSTQARNDYIMALAAGNAHLTHHYEQDLPNLLFSIDDAILDKCQTYVLSLLDVERELVNSWSEVVNKSTEYWSNTSADYTNAVFLKDPHSAPICETLVYEFQSCDNDSMDFISLDHNADIALRNEGQKWFTWFSKECRNLNRLSAQLVKMQALQLEGHRTVEVSSRGSVDIETRIDEIRQQLRQCEISKLKAKARLQVIRESGAEVEDFDAMENQVAQEIKQQSLDVDLNIGLLSRTPSVRSNMGSSEARSPVPSKPYIAPEQTSLEARPESSSSAEQLDSPDREVLQLGSSMECTSPAPGSAAVSSAAAAAWDYDPTQVAWDEEPAPTNSSFNGYEDQTASHQTVSDYGANQTTGSMEDSTDHGAGAEQALHEYHDYEHYQQQTADGFAMVGKSCYVLYAYNGQGEDELTVVEQETISVIDASDKDWVRAQNQHGQMGYVPAAYLQIMDAIDSMSPQPEGAWDTTESEPPLPPPITSVTTSELESEPLPPPPPPSEPVHASPHHHHHHEYVKAIYDYEATNSEEISFSAGDHIKIIDNSSDDGWWTGENKEGQVGHFLSMLVSSLNEDEEDDEESSVDEEEDEEDEESTFHPPPSIDLPAVAPPLPPLPPPESANAPDGAPPSFAPPPKPMTLMAPQTVVIIQPTPEIESRPALGSEDFDESGGQGTESSESTTNDTFETIERKQSEPVTCNGGGTEQVNSITVSMAIAVEEISESITQQAMDDSMRELSRRTSGASSQDGGVEAVAPTGEVAHSGAAQPNGSIHNGPEEGGEEDCK